MATAMRNKEVLYTTSCAWGECEADETSMTFRCKITVDFSKWYSSHPGGASISCNPRTFIWAYRYWDDDTPDVLRVDTRNITVTASEPTFTAEIEHTLMKSSSKSFDVYMGLAVYDSSESSSIASTEALKYNSKIGSTTAWTSAKALEKAAVPISVTVVPASSSPLVTTEVSIDGIVADDSSATVYTLPTDVVSEETDLASRKRVVGWSVDWRHDGSESDVVQVGYTLRPGDTFRYCNIHSSYGITSFTPIWGPIGSIVTGRFLHSSLDGGDDEVLFTMKYLSSDEVFIPTGYRMKETENETFLGWTFDEATAYQPGDSLGYQPNGFDIYAWTQYFEDAKNPRKIWVYCEEKDRWLAGDPWMYRSSAGEWV